MPLPITDDNFADMESIKVKFSDHAYSAYNTHTRVHTQAHAHTHTCKHKTSVHTQHTHTHK